MSEENQALLSIAERQDSRALKTAQMDARKVLRAQAKAVIDGLKERLKSCRQELKTAIHISNDSIDEQFADKRIDGLRSHTLPARIAKEDASKLPGAPVVRVYILNTKPVKQTSTILQGSEREIPMEAHYGQA
jgi:hypothetical protein